MPKEAVEKLKLLLRELHMKRQKSFARVTGATWLDELCEDSDMEEKSPSPKKESIKKPSIRF